MKKYVIIFKLSLVASFINQYGLPAEKKGRASLQPSPRWIRADESRRMERVECVICREEGDLINLHCHKTHCFHIDCLKQQQSPQNEICPFCRTELNREEKKLIITRAAIHVNAPLVVRIGLSLHEAIESRYRANNLEAILENNIDDIDTVNLLGNTPIHEAVRAGYLFAVEMLINANADLEIKNNDGLTPLLIAAKEGRQEIAQALIQAGARIDEKDAISGNTVLHFTAKHHYKDLTEYLITSFRANNVALDATNNDGHTPHDLAQQTKAVYLMRSTDYRYNGCIRALNDIMALLSQ